jgi:hypothetical protein
MQQRTKSRLFAGFGFAWITVVVLVSRTNAPTAATLAWVEYGAIGIIAMVGIWRGRDADPAWTRRMGRVQLAGFLVAVGLFLVAALPKWI